MVSAAVRIEPDAVYDDALLYREQGIPSATLARARRCGELRYTRKGGRILYLGQWILDWLQASSEPESEAPDA